MKRRMKFITLTLSDLPGDYARDPRTKPLNPLKNPYPFVVQRMKHATPHGWDMADGNHRAGGMYKWARLNRIDPANISLKVIDRSGASESRVESLLRQMQRKAKR